ncbi:hypothetical protein VPNG_07206 [Cytospora leucostoma]|uniref:Uncharacterized protein n=1 Tax=Cytospora leucostoma TaxID=1230097 RepID=A0A423WJM9_9PEZI|nr:hypothetical protein VPNG_07206 [Cytospora leucostoma]
MSSTAASATLPQPSNDDIDKSGVTSLVSWELANGTTENLQAVQGGSSSTLCRPKLHIRYESASRTAFFKFQLSILLKPKRNKAKNTAQLFVLIPPESINTLSATSGENLPEIVRNLLSGDTVCLRFALKTPPTVICPPAPARLVPKNEHSAGILASLQELARQTNIAIHLSHRTLDQFRLQALCTAASSSALTSGAFNNTATLYGGQGGRPLDASIIADVGEDIGVYDAAELPAAESPPSYNDLGPGPPPEPSPSELPAAAEPRKRPRRSSSNDRSRSTSPSYGSERKVLKQKRCPGNVEPLPHEDDLGNQVIQAGHLEKTELAELLELQIERMEQRLTTRLDCRLDRFEQLVTEQLQEHKRSVTEMVDERMDHHEEQTQIVLDHLRREVESDVEEQLITKKAELDEQFKDEREDIQAGLEERFADLEESITARFSSARAYLEFD